MQREYAWLSVWHRISQQRCEIDRKPHIASPMVTWPMTSRDQERSKSWPQCLWSLISQKPCEMYDRLKLNIRKPHIANPFIGHVTWQVTSLTPKGQCRNSISLKLNISRTVMHRRFILTTNRKPRIESPMVTWAMVSFIANCDSLRLGSLLENNNAAIKFQLTMLKCTVIVGRRNRYLLPQNVFLVNEDSAYSTLCYKRIWP